jgi:hypothetical protein
MDIVDSSYIVSSQTAENAPLLAVALLRCVVAVATDCIGNTASNISSVVACLNVVAVTGRLPAIA